MLDVNTTNSIKGHRHEGSKNRDDQDVRDMSKMLLRTQMYRKIKMFTVLGVNIPRNIHGQTRDRQN